MAAFFAAYFAILHNPGSPPVEIPLTAPDRWIGFQPAALIPYASLWLYVMLPSSLMIRFRELLGHTFGAAVLSVSGLAIFFIWPTTMPPVAIDWDAHPQIQFLKTIDASGNACPSLHVAFAVFSACWLARMLRRVGAGPASQTINIIWAVVIGYSTVATRQHVALDVLAGALLGGLIAYANLRLCPEAPEPTSGPRRIVLSSGFPLTYVALIKITGLVLWPFGLPLPWVCVLFFGPDLWVLYHVFVPGASGLVRTFTRFETRRPEVWLTIDDGPDEQDTPRILDLLDRHEARATFFLVGERAARHPALVAEILRRGHEIGHHTHKHSCATFWLKTPARVHRELDNAFPPLTSAEGVRPRRFRPPVGIKNIFLRDALAKRGLACVAWSVRSRDTFSRNPDNVAARVLRQARPGSILLMHEGASLHNRVRVTAIARVLDGLSARGLRCVIPTDAQLK